MQRGSRQTEAAKELIRRAHLGKPGKKHSAKTKKLLSDLYWKRHRKESENEQVAEESTEKKSNL